MITRYEGGVHTDKLSTRLLLPEEQPESWKKVLADSVTDPEELLGILNLPKTLLPGAISGDKAFSMRIPRPYIDRMIRGDQFDPLLRQVLPLGEESEEISGYSLDPLAEQSQNPTEGIIHKYQGRLLMIVSGACAINCRFCFRRHFPYGDNQLGGESWKQAIAYIRSQESIHEVILSGGDPLAATDSRLARMVDALSDIPHVKTLRIHTRLPIVIPQRVTDEMIEWFCKGRLKPVLVIHCNHANEIDDHVAQSLQKLRQAGATLLNQTVLLRGVNDNAETLADLSHTLFDAGVLPYYLHLLDRVQGAAHFDIAEEKAKVLVNELMHQCPGYLVPKLVREVAGEASKTPIPIN
ncbi:EF-P beta-lysylation protein EpmB [Endozoicomonas arenosclerae]|uniref:EF-P beta-lysylation protein EpmB n=1 Tax=Endozoicomonas arenosclerae TaxID=1633495 RepID=UPI0009A1E842|nr:EF-P beta-lysylation protein EpmB [Endozoicomonas arenosclerae]